MARRARRQRRLGEDAMNARRNALGLLVGWSLAACAARPESQQPPPPQAPVSAPATQVAARAQAGDTIYVVELFVRPERRRHFEDFVQEVLWPAFQHIEGSTGRPLLTHTRMLVPLHENADTSYTYTFLLDPVVAGEPYDLLALLRARYGDEEAVRQYERFTETWKRDFTARPFVQSVKPTVR
jgi:hypothetical protein